MQKRVSTCIWAGLLMATPVFVPAFAPAFADDLLIRETESLRDSLAASDSSRLPLTLRLADLCMEEAASSDFNRKFKLERRALALYDEALSGRLEGIARLRVEFQRARILTDLGEIDRALPAWKRIAENRALPDLAREAALKLAEAGDVGRASHWYAVALELCSGGDLCSYVHYKRAWLFKQEGSGSSGLARAIAEIELALFDSKGLVREEALRDYLVFLGEQQASSAPASLAKVEALALKLGRPGLVGELAEAYFSAGNKEAGTLVLSQAQRVTPQFARLCRLAEEQYGLRQWDAFRVSLEELAGSRVRSLQVAASDAERAEAEKLLRRLVIQLDGERISQPGRKQDFQQATLVYLSLYPSSPEKSKFQEGFLVSESDPRIKLDQLDRWIHAEPSNVRLREFKAQVAQKAGMNDLLAMEMAELARLTGSREHRYLQARALYEAKKYEPALSLFVGLAATDASGGASLPDRWAIQSQNLALDILAMDKSPQGLLRVEAQASKWLDAVWARAGASRGLAAELVSELANMSRIRDQARFERAVALGQSSEALAQFLGFCRDGFVAQKSCENARVLSLQLKDQPALIEVLSIQAVKQPALGAVLASELERSGMFAHAADLIEKQKLDQRDLQQSFKLAALRELSGDRPGCERALFSIQKRDFKLSEAQEKLWLSMLRDSGALKLEVLRGLKSDGARALAAEWLEQGGQGGAQSRQILMSASRMTGPSWARHVMDDLESKIEAQGRISFYGRNSKALFEKRLRAVGALALQADGWISRSDEATRSAIASRLQGVYEQLSREIRESPIPEGVPVEAIAELKAGLEELARPFAEKAQVYAAAVLPVSDSLTTQVAHAQTRIEPPSREIQAATARLAREPDSVEVLTELRNLYRALRNERLAGYFEGRLQAGGNP